MKMGQIGAMVLGGMLIGATAGMMMKNKMGTPRMKRMYRKGKRVAQRLVRNINL